MPTIIITAMSPGQLFNHMLEKARCHSVEIQRLKDAPLAPGETLADRALAVAAHAHELSDAFETIEALIAQFNHQVSPPRPSAEPSPGHRGVHQERDDPSTN